MWKPDQSLDDYIVNPNREGISETPRAASLRATGEVEVLKPLTPQEVCATPDRIGIQALHRPGPHQPLWFRRFVAAGSGALVMIALILVSAILVGINDPVDGLDVATFVKPDDDSTQPEELFSFDFSSPSTFTAANGGVNIVRSNFRRRRARPRIHTAPNKPKLLVLPPPQAEQPKFVPTTLVIYAENGVINTRIEPWLQWSNNF